MVPPRSLRSHEACVRAGKLDKGTIYPQKCDVSPDGRWFAASILKANADWPAGDIYEQVSRLP